MSPSHIRIAALTGAALVAGGLMPWPTETRLAAHIQNATHPVGFAVAAFVLVLAFGRERRVATALATGFGLLALGIGIELVQALVGRTASLADVGADVAGILGGVLAALAVRPTSKVRAAALLVGGLTALGIGLTPHMPYLIASAARPSPPVIEDFSGPFALERIWIADESEGTIVSLDAEGADVSNEVVSRANAKALRLRFGDEPWPGMQFVDPEPDWSGAAAVVLELRNPSHEAMDVNLRVNDALHDNELEDRWQGAVHVPPGTTRHEFALEDIERMGQADPARRMALDRIADVIVFGDARLAGRELDVVSLSLVPR